MEAGCSHSSYTANSSSSSSNRLRVHVLSTDAILPCACHRGKLLMSSCSAAVHAPAYTQPSYVLITMAAALQCLMTTRSCAWCLARSSPCHPR